MPYQTCLRLVRGEFVFTPLSDACEVQKALREATKGRYTPPEGVPERACLCLECDGND